MNENDDRNRPEQIDMKRRIALRRMALGAIAAAGAVLLGGCKDLVGPHRYNSYYYSYSSYSRYSRYSSYYSYYSPYSNYYNMFG